ncbi:MAG: tetratricopeptide repeat protein [Candidatus Marinimicrobia bacterium]|jgi:tetratricopeptide (TPR) repeat protein|nr:tetratricopeptide repeat protein [Candidatus Neomarinimicrobiota bacterium]MBT3502338.1 tetratricopeptide repeat protein [Candidatus Neomarinimicrobiota bacterium]MBT3840380.1 tetratricopeptide repeat protein [Candidatus Neomarinimicrobiota bacterium]MBT3999445.1 tetratricopeptide repeat protein [Candidatus Neomarinimicrobiota bacterium]MBT4282038.1 tetratricopeptide repeat protein [Candidatus Neomarinimicrobiota bacterium]
MRKFKIIGLLLSTLFISMCVPPEGNGANQNSKDKASLDSLRNVRCPRLMSSAAEYYRNRDWKQTVLIYKEITTLDCDEWNPVYAPPREIYQFYAIAYEQMGKFDSSEFVLLDGLQKLPGSVDLRKGLAYSYKRQGKTDREIIEYERLVDMAPDDMSVMNYLSTLYKDEGRYDDQIYILEKILKYDQNNEIAQSELAMAFGSSGRDPLDVYRKRYEGNLENLSYGLDYADRLTQVDRFEDAIPVLNSVILQDPSSKLAYRKLAEAHKETGNYSKAAKAYEDLFKIDPRDSRIAINISDSYLENGDYVKALRWADKASTLDGGTGEGFGQKGKVYYYGWESFRSNPFSTDDRVVAKLAYDYFIKAENKGFSGYSKSAWLNENSKDILYGKAQWFMAEDKVRRTRSISTSSSNYDWVTEPLKAETGWK